MSASSSASSLAQIAGVLPGSLDLAGLAGRIPIRVDDCESPVAFRVDVETDNTDSNPGRGQEHLAEVLCEQTERLIIAALLQLEPDVLLDDRQEPGTKRSIRNRVE